MADSYRILDRTLRHGTTIRHQPKKKRSLSTPSAAYKALYRLFRDFLDMYVFNEGDKNVN